MRSEGESINLTLLMLDPQKRTTCTRSRLFISNKSPKNGAF